MTAEFAVLPSHLAVIMDGNGRWAKSRGLSRSDGHKAGVDAAQRMVEDCRALGIPYLTLYAFSTENWSRPADEVHFLFDLMAEYINRKLTDFIKRDIKVRILGETAPLPFAARKALELVCKRTAKARSMTVNLALNYSGREELARAFRLMAADGLDKEGFTPEAISRYLYTSGQPDPDLIIRTSGEMRLSNFLLFQSAYSELYFTDVQWPDFQTRNLHDALAHFAGRKRRFGRVEEPAEPPGQPGDTP